MVKEYIDQYGKVQPVPNDTEHPYSHLSTEETDKYFGKRIESTICTICGMSINSKCNDPLTCNNKSFLDNFNPNY